MSVNPLRVTPDIIFFRDLATGESDSVDVWVHNSGSSPLPIRFVLSSKSPFTLTKNPTGLTAPGLDAQATVKYTAKSNKVVTDVLHVTCPGQEVEIPLKAHPPSARVVPEKLKFALGTVGYQSDFRFVFQLSNIGVKEGNFSLTSDEKCLTLIPASGVILPSKSVEITASFRPEKMGDTQFEIFTKLEDGVEDIPSISVTATVVSQALTLLLDDVEVSEIDFGTVFFGQKRVMTAKVVNKGPYKRSFVVMPPSNAPIGSQAKGKGNTNVPPPAPVQNDIVFSAIPPEGMLNPYGSMEVKFVFNPPIEEPNEDDIESVFTQYSAIEVVETGQRMDLTLNGKAVQLLMDLDSIDFNFDRSDVGERTVQTLKVTNKSHFLPIDFKLKPMAHFRFEPMKGTVPAQQSKNVSIVFFPKNFGVFETITKISFCHRLIVKTINLTGICSSEDTNKKFQRIPMWETEPEVRFNAEHPDTRFGYDLTQIKENLKMREKFDAYITDQAKEREIRTEAETKRRRARQMAEAYLTSTLGRYTEEDVIDYLNTHPMNNEDDGLGLEVHEGLVAPDPPVSRKPCPLYLENPEKFGIVRVEEPTPDQSNLVSRQMVHMDDNVTVKKKFKPKATTPAEINECMKPLTPAQQLMVIPSHQTVNVGQISVFATVVKSFNICNNLQQNILVTLNYEYDELCDSFPVSQVIPPKSTGGFDITFCSKKPQNFMKTITYTINNHHKYTFNMVAQVIPIEVQISRSVLEFRFSPDSTSPYIKEFLTLQNKSNAKAEFSFSGLMAPFSVDMPTGFIEPNRNLNVEITYHPTTKPHEEQNVVLKVNGGASRSLKLVGDTGSSRCSLAKKTVNFGLIPIGIARTQTLRLKNTGEDDAIFSVSVSNPSELQVSPMNGRVAAREYQTLQVTYKSLHAHNFDISATVAICGANPLTFNVTGQSELPQVSIQRSEFDFGRVFVGSSAAIETVLTNDGAIPAILILDLQGKPDFRIEYPSEYEGNDLITLVSDPTFVTKMEATSEYISAETPHSARMSARTEDRDDESRGLMYKLNLAEKSTLKFTLVFQPTEVSDYSFELPITMMNVISSAFHIQPIVSAEAVQAPLEMSTTSINFGVSPIYDPHNPNSRAVVETVTFSNEGKSALEWRFDELSLPDVFNVEPVNGTIEPNTNTVVHIVFTPRQGVPYNLFLPVYVKTEKDENLVGKLQLTGVGSSLPFRVKVSEVCLPIVPLNVRSECQIWVYNEGFIAATLQAQMPVDDTHFPVRISFPDGPQLEHTTAKLPVVVSFQASKPMSFSTVVALVDEKGNGTSFTVTCTTDNSVFTLYPYLEQKKRGSTLNLRKMVDSCELTAKFLTHEDVLDLKKVAWKPSCSPMTIEFCERYLNALVLNTQISDFPGDLIHSQGHIVMEAVANLSGGKVTCHLDHNRDGTEEDRKESMKKMLHYLMSNGALLSSVHPEFLLDRVDFMALMRKKVTKQLLGLDYFSAPPLSSFDQQVLSDFTNSKSFSTALVTRMNVLEKKFDALSTESWMMVLMQVFKLFVMSKIDPEKFHSVPGVMDGLRQIKESIKDLPNAKEIWADLNKKGLALQSNVYSPQELTLLKWVNIHYCLMTQNYNRRFADYSSLHDSVALAAVVKSHTNVYPENLIEEPVDEGQMEQNAIEFTNSMKELKLAFSPRACEIFHGKAHTLSLSLSYLFDVLPHYLPTATIEFSTTLHKPITKGITLTNPSKSEICYRAKYEGSNGFSLVQETFVIGPGQTGEFPVVFHARSLKPITGRIMLMPSRPRFVSKASARDDDDEDRMQTARGTRMPQYSAPVVFNLVSDVTIAGPDVTLTMETCIYETEKLTAAVNNLLGAPANLTLVTKVQKIEDETGKVLIDKKRMAQDMIDFMNEPPIQREEPAPTTYEGYLKSHQQFIISQDQISLERASSKSNIEIEFNPISLGKYRCLILFADDDLGEFVYEIIAKSTLPPSVETCQGKFKTECGKKCLGQVPVDAMNPNIVRTLAYSIEKANSLNTSISDRKFKELLAKRQRDLEGLFRQGFSSKKFTVMCSSPQYFEVANDLVISKSGTGSEPVTQRMTEKSSANALPVTFKPAKPGDYPCKFVLLSTYDVRVYTIKGIGLAATKELSLTLETVSGKPIRQDIPVRNVSNDTWQYRVGLSGDACFSCPPRLSVKPQSTQMLSVTFSPTKIGTYSGEVTITNLNKEATVIYQLIGTAGEPPAEEKLVYTCQARDRTFKTLNVKPFMRNGTAQVTCTVPIIKCPSTLEFPDSSTPVPFDFQIFATRSGMTAGTITFTDKQTENYIWYVIEVSVDSPKPEQTIEVSTTVRKCQTVTIPISNPKDYPAKFTVQITDEDLFGDKEFTVPPKSSFNYEIVVSPLKATKKMSAVYFYSDDEGEFWYCIKIQAEEAAECILAPLSAPIGSYASTYVLLENPSKNQVSFRVENDNEVVFQVVAKRVIKLGPMEKKRIEIKYIPTAVGVKETGLIAFKSSDIGEWLYRLNGSGKPPQSLSPTIVSAPVNNANSAMILFTNPFPYPARFSVSMSCDDCEENVFKFLGRRKIFTLNNYNEEFQIPFTFTPKQLGQYTGNIVIASVGPARGALPELETLPSITWVYPIIGNSVTSNFTDVKQLKCRAHEVLDTKLSFTLVGETDAFKATEYSLDLDLPNAYDFVRPALDIRATGVVRKENTSELEIAVTFSPKRPLSQSVLLTIRNPLKQEWQFRLELSVDIGKVQTSVKIESLLNKTGTARIELPVVFRQQTPFHAYFAAGSASEFSVSPEHGMIEPTLLEVTELPIEISFSPKMYGKILKGLLVVDTIDSQFLVEVSGKTPEYVPPVVNKSSHETTALASRQTTARTIQSSLAAPKKRNIIRDNIENCRIVKPRNASTMKPRFR